MANMYAFSTFEGTYLKIEMVIRSFAEENCCLVWAPGALSKAGGRPRQARPRPEANAREMAKGTDGRTRTDAEKQRGGRRVKGD